MKDPSSEILKSVYTLLNNNLVVDTVNYPVYSIVPNDIEYNYVHISGLNLTDNGTKDSYTSMVAILCDVVTGGFKNRGTWTIADSIANQLQVLFVRKNLTFTNFKISVLPFLESNLQLEEKTDTGLILRKELRYIFSVQQI